MTLPRLFRDDELSAMSAEEFAVAIAEMEEHVGPIPRDEIAELLDRTPQNISRAKHHLGLPPALAFIVRTVLVRLRSRPVKARGKS